MLFNLSCFLVIVFVSLICLKHIRKRKRHPPGPLGFPYVGLLPFQIIQMIFSNFLPKVSQMKLFRKMKESYGDYWSIEMGGQRFVVLASYEIINEALINNAKLFAARPINEVYKKFGKFKGIIFVNGETWANNRNLLTKGLREMGMGSNILASQICYESNEFIKYLISISSSPVNPLNDFMKVTSNVLTKLIFNDRDDYNDITMDTFAKNMSYALRSEVIHTKCAMFPKFATTELARYLFSDLDKFFKAWEDIRDFVIDKCKKHSRYQNENEDPISTYEHFWRDRYPDCPDMAYDPNKMDVYQSMTDLYFAGIETNSNFFVFACLMLGYYPEIQDELRREINSISDNYTTITIDMRKDCPKLLSFLDEVLRFCIVVSTFPRAVMNKCMFMGYQLYPEDVVLGDFGTISRNPTLFKNPESFDPYRFMDDSKTTYVPNKYMITFGIGKRSCLGAPLASTEQFLIVSRILQVFQVSLTKETLKNFDNIIDGNFGLSHGALDCEIKFQLIKTV